MRPLLPDMALALQKEKSRASFSGTSCAKRGAMSFRVLLAACCGLVAYAPSALAEDEVEDAAASTEESASEESASEEENSTWADIEEDAQGSDEPRAPSRGLKWPWLSVGLSGRYGPMSGASGWWGDLIVAARTSTEGSLGFRFELGGGYGHISNTTDIPMSTMSDPRIVENYESMDILSGLFRVQLELPEDPLRLRIGPAIGVGTGDFHSDTSSCGNEVWNRLIGGGSVDVAVGLGDPVFLEPFVRFDLLYLGTPQCVQGDPVAAHSSTLQEPRVTTSDSVGLFVGAGLLLSL